MAAIHAAFAIFRPGDHILIGDQLYGGTYRLLNQYFKLQGIAFTTVDTRNLEKVEAAIQNNTKAIYFEPVTNPLLQVTSVREIATIAKRHNLLTIVDNTFLTPYLQRPLELGGADLVVHSATKYLSGHSDVIAGLVVAKTAALGQKIYFVQNALGGVLSPESANLVRRGIQTLGGVRMEREQQNVAALIEFLQQRPEVVQLNYPGIAGTKDHAIAARECRGGYGGVFSFVLDANTDATTFVNNLHLLKLAVSLGGAVESLVELPYEMSHAELPPQERIQAGITPQLIRCAIGIEDCEDLIADIRAALAVARKKTAASV